MALQLFDDSDIMTAANNDGGAVAPTEAGDLGRKSNMPRKSKMPRKTPMPSPLVARMTKYCASTTTSEDINRFETFQYKDLADVAETVKHSFDELTGVSPLWFSVEKDEDAGAGSHSLSRKSGGGGYELFGDWRVEESLVDVFENQAQAGSDKQEILKVVNALLATYDENGAKQRQGLEECVRAFETAIEGDLNAQLDTQTEQCTRRWNEEKEKAEAAHEGLTELEARTVARLEGLGQVLKDRQSTVMATLKHEREANTRKILAAALSDPLEEGRLLFERQVEETQLEGRLKQRRRLLDLSSHGVQVQQEEIEAALLQAERDQVDNLMQVVDKMQSQQTKLLVTLQAEKKKVAIMRQHVSSRLDASSKRQARKATEATDRATFKSRGKKSNAMKIGQAAALAVEAAVTIGKKPDEVAGEEGNASAGVDGDGDDNGLGGEGDQLSGVDLLEACDRLENDNLALRQRLAKLELQKMQKEHGDDHEEFNDDSQLAPVLEAKKELQRQLEGLQMANEERSKELERAGGLTAVITITHAGKTDTTDMDEFKADIEAETKTLTQKVKTLRRKLVFKLACKVMRRRFQEVGLGAGNNPNPPPGPVATDGFQAEAADGHGLPQDMQLHAALLQQKVALQREIERAAREEDELQRAMKEAEGIHSSGATTGGNYASTGRNGGDGAGSGRSRGGSGDGQSGSGVEEGDGDGAGGAPTLGRSSAKIWEGGRGVAGKSSVQTKSVGYDLTRLRKLARMMTIVRRRLAALRTVAEKNEQVARVNTVDAVDNEAVEAVLRNEEIAREKALAVLDILCSRGMAKARARWLREALDRSMKAQTKPASKQTSSAASVAPATSGPVSVDVAPSAIGNEEGAQISDGATTINDEKRNDEQSTQGKSAVVRAPAPGGGGEDRQSEPLKNAPPTAEAEAVVAAAPEAPATAEADAEATAHGTPEDGTQAREMEECEKLVNMRAEKLLLIKDLREKVKAAGGIKPRSMSQELKKQEIQRAMKKAKEAQGVEKNKKLAATEGKNKEIFKTLPPKTKRVISNLRKQEALLIARYELYVERIKKLLLNKGFSPPVAPVVDPVADHSPDQKQPTQPRKWTATERRKEAFLHSLTPQLERWRARIVATTLVLEEEKARRDTEEAYQEPEVAPGESKDRAPSPEVAPPPGRMSGVVLSDEPLGERRRTLSRASARGENFYVDSHLFTNADIGLSPATAAAAAARAAAHSDHQATKGHSFGSADRGGGSGGGGGHTHPRSDENAVTVGEGGGFGTDQGFLHEANGSTGRAKEASRRLVATIAAANFHGNKKYLRTDNASSSAFLTPRPPAGSPTPSSPSPRSPNLPPAMRYALQRWEPQRSSASENGDPQDHSQEKQQPGPSPAPAMGSNQALNFYPLAAATTNHSNVSVVGVDASFGWTVTLPTETGRRGLHHHHSEPRLGPQWALLSPRLSPHYQWRPQQQQQLETDARVGGGTIPPRRGSPQRPHSTSSLWKPYDDAELQRRQLMRQLQLHPGRPTAKRATTAGHGGGDHMPSVGGVVPGGLVTSPSSPPSVSPSSPVKVPPALNIGLLVLGESVALVSSPRGASSPSGAALSPRGAALRERRTPPLTSGVGTKADDRGRKPSPSLPQKSLLRLATGEADAIVSSLSAGQIVAQIFQHAGRENAAELEETGGDGRVSGEPEPNSYDETATASSSTIRVAQLQQQQEGRRPLVERDASLSVHVDRLQRQTHRRRVSSAWFASSQNGDPSSSANFSFYEKRWPRKRSPKKGLPKADSSPTRRLVAQKTLATLRGTKINASNTTAAASNVNTIPNQVASVSPRLSSMTSAAAVFLGEGRRPFAEEGGNRRPLTDKFSVPTPTAIDDVLPQASSKKREINMVGPGSSSYRDKQHQSGSSSTARNNRGAPSSPPAERWRGEFTNGRMWGGSGGIAIGRVDSSSAPVRVSSSTRRGINVVGIGSSSYRDKQHHSESSSTAKNDRGAPSSPPAERWQGELSNGRMWGGRAGIVIDGADSSSAPVRVVSPQRRRDKNAENLLEPLLTDSRRTPTGQEVRERGKGEARGLQREEDDSARETAAGTASAKQTGSDGGGSFHRGYSGSPPPSPGAWTPATGKRPLFSGGEV